MKTAKGILSYLFLTIVTASALPAAALAADGYEPPEREYSPPWMAILYAVIFAAAVAAVAFKNSKRTHLD